MNCLVADASLLVKCVLSESGSDRARELLAGPEPPIAPAHCVAESANAIWKQVHRGLLSPEHALRVLGEVRVMPVRQIPLRQLTDIAFGLALEFDHPVYDCYYLAAAIQRDCELVTADQRLYDLAQRVGFGERTILVR